MSQAASSGVSIAQEGPLYVQVADCLCADIQSGRLSAGGRLPSEREMRERFGVSRVTVRQALGRLVSAGLVAPSPGRGWFVRAATLAEPPGTLASFTEMVRGAGLVASSRVLDRQIRDSTLDEAEALRLAPGSPLLSLYRLRMVDGLATALDHSRLPLAIAPRLAEVDFAACSLYATLAAAGAPPARAEYCVTAQAATADQAALLGVAPGAPLLAATQTTYDRSGQPIELGAITYRGDRYRFRAVLTADSDSVRTLGPW
ncbi:MAG: GntR family transcriptional regulator [Actinomycetota bacterium]|nr:GntR family transcriptional regulator [Actinomycetota bacterium]